MENKVIRMENEDGFGNARVDIINRSVLIPEELPVDWMIPHGIHVYQDNVSGYLKYNKKYIDTVDEEIVGHIYISPNGSELVLLV